MRFDCRYGLYYSILSTNSTTQGIEVLKNITTHFKDFFKHIITHFLD